MLPLDDLIEKFTISFLAQVEIGDALGLITFMNSCNVSTLIQIAISYM
jgi:hypothetical protein